MGLCHTRRMTSLGALGVVHREACAVTVCQVQGELPGVGWGGRPSLMQLILQGVELPAYSANTSSPAHTNLSREITQEFGPTGPAYRFPFSGCPLSGCSPVPPHLEQRAGLSLMPPESLSILDSPGTQQINALIPRQFLKLSSLLVD